MAGNSAAFVVLEPVTGTCPVCEAPLKWAEIRLTSHGDGTRSRSRILVCKENHRTDATGDATPQDDSPGAPQG